MFYKTTLPFNEKSWADHYEAIKDTIEYKFFGRGSNGLYQGVMPESELTEEIRKYIPGVLNLSFIKILSGSRLTAHTDTRCAGLNCPIYVPEDSMNEMYSDSGNEMVRRRAYMSRPKESTAEVFLRAELVESFYLDTPTLLNTHCPHGVSKSNKDRVVMSITFDDNWNDYEKIRGELIKRGY